MAFTPTKELIDQVFGVTAPGPLEKDRAKNNGLGAKYLNSGAYIDPATFFPNPEGKDTRTPIGIFTSHQPENLSKKAENSQKRSKNAVIKTGFPELDGLLGELKDGSLTLIAGLPGVGKTSLALNIAEHAAADNDAPVGFFSLDIDREELLTRLVSARSRVTLDSIYSGFVTPAERKDLNTALECLYNAPVYIDANAGHSSASIKKQALACKDRLGLKLLVIDCMQLIGTEPNSERRLRKISSELKALAGELSIPVIVTYQLPRSWQNKKIVPHPSFILKQGAAEHYSADNVILIYRRGVCRECHSQIELCTCALDLDTRLVVAHKDSPPQGVAHLRFLSSSVHFEAPPVAEQRPIGR